IAVLRESVVLRAPPLVLLFLSYRGAHPHLHSFPTRRSSDLAAELGDTRPVAADDLDRERRDRDQVAEEDRVLRAQFADCRVPGRSEEHTSELQSRVDLVCRLLLEKKKQRAQ